MNVSNTESIGDRIRKLRKKNEMTQQQLADKIVVQRGLVNYWENNTREIKSSDLISLSIALNTSCDYILRGIQSHNLSVHDEMGLSDPAIQNIRLITCTAFGVKEDEPNKFNVNTEFRDLLDELLSSPFLLHLVIDMKLAVESYASVMDPILDVEIDTLPPEIMEPFNYQLWRCQRTLTDMIEKAIKSYYDKTKDGQMSYTVELSGLNNEEELKTKLSDIPKGAKVHIKLAFEDDEPAEIKPATGSFFKSIFNNQKDLKK